MSRSKFKGRWHAMKPTHEGRGMFKVSFIHRVTLAEILHSFFLATPRSSKSAWRYFLSYPNMPLASYHYTPLLGETLPNVSYKPYNQLVVGNTAKEDFFQSVNQSSQKRPDNFDEILRIKAKLDTKT